LRTVNQLYPNPDAVAERRPFLEKALAVLAQMPAPLSAEDLHVKAAALENLGQAQEAAREYRAALLSRPREVEWRYELAGLLYQDRQLQESRRELLTVLAQHSGHQEARALLEA